MSHLLSISMLVFLTVAAAQGQQAPAPIQAAVTDVLTAEAVLAMVRKGEFSDDVSAKILEVLTSKAAAEPTNVDWQIGLALWNVRTRNFILARDIARRATELAPESSQAWSTCGTVIFMGINDAPTLDKMGLADDGKDAYLQAVQLDANNIEARQGLAQFYINAPGIAGGSLKKAREQGNALLQIKGCEFQGRLVLGMIEAEDDEYENAAKEFSLARDVAANTDEKLIAISARANMLLSKKEDYKATIALITPLVDSFGVDGWRLLYFRGQAHRELKNWAAAQADFEAIIAKKPDARNSRFGLGEVLRKQRKYAEAAKTFREFAKLFPTDERAKKAIEEAEDCDGRS